MYVCLKYKHSLSSEYYPIRFGMSPFSTSTLNTIEICLFEKLNDNLFKIDLRKIINE